MSPANDRRANRTTTIASRLWALITGLFTRPHERAGHLLRLADTFRADDFVREWNAEPRPAPMPPSTDPTASPNPLRAYFDAHTSGPGVWKWMHYFDIYHRHFQKFVGRDVHVVEVGVYSGGSLQMWQHYFGERCRVTGIDTEDACKIYENDTTRIAIGDQGDPAFWARFRAEFPPIDILIDDGSHMPLDQVTTLEETLRYLKPGGVYLCEDTGGVGNRFVRYAQSVVAHLNAIDLLGPNLDICRPRPAQAAVYSAHFYPFVVVIEKTDIPTEYLVLTRRGSEWQEISKTSFRKLLRED
ncbi:MAG: class I SAM-dependent methyltransferase [Acidobacteriota bacterium]